MSRKPDTGGKALVALVYRRRSAPARIGARAALQALLREHQGNYTRASADLGLGTPQALRALVAELQLGEWVEQQWPGHSRRTTPPHPPPQCATTALS